MKKKINPATNCYGEKLMSRLEQHASFSTNDKKLILKHISTKEIKKGDFFLKEGEVVNKIAFILNGAFRCFIYDENGEEVTSLFFDENNFMSYHSRFLENSKSMVRIEAILDSNIVVMDKKSWDTLSTEVANWGEASASIRAEYLEDLAKFQRNIIHQDAKNAYLIFTKKHFNLHQKIPLRYISSFLGITQSSLSRIRKCL